MPQLNLNLASLKHIPGWLGEARLFWYFIGAIAFASVLGDWLGTLADVDREARIRYAGYLLEVLGLISVALGLSKKLDLFHSKSVWKLFKDATYAWVFRCPLFKQDRNILASTGHMAVSSPNVELYAKVKINPSKSPEEKLNWLLDRYYDLVDIVQQAQRDIRANKRQCEQQLKELRAALEEAIGEVEAQTAKAHVGEIGGEFVGLGWILSGVTFATVPEGIQSWFGWLIELFEWLGDLVVFL